MTELKNVIDKELLSELIERIGRKDINCSFAYFYETDEIAIDFKSGGETFKISQNWDAKKCTRTREYWETYCLPYISNKQEKEHLNKADQYLNQLKSQQKT
jgi:hypothetical protein